MRDMQPIPSSGDPKLKQLVVFMSHFFSPARRCLAAGHEINVGMEQVDPTKSDHSRAAWYRYASHMLKTICT
jgi:hypothetical protein